MTKKDGVLFTGVFLMICFCATAAFAQGTSGEDLKAKLNDLQAKKEQVAKEYQAAVDQVNSEAEGKMRQLKADYKKARRSCANDRDAKCEKLRQEYDAKMQPLSAEEKQVISAMVPSQRMNFAKPKYERQEKKGSTR